MCIGHEGHLRRPDPANERNKFGGRITLNVELRIHLCLQVKYVAITDVTLIGAGMNGDAISAEKLAVHSHLHHIREISAAGISQGRDFVYIYTKFRHIFLLHKSLPKIILLFFPIAMDGKDEFPHEFDPIKII
jgi:hypothetical protein